MNGPDIHSLAPEGPDMGRFPVLRHFRYDHLPAALQAVSAPFAKLAVELAVGTQPDTVPPSVASRARSAEMAVALRKLLEAKDAAVRSRLA